MMYEKDAGGRETPGLEDYLAAIRQRAVLIAIFGLLGLLAAFVFTATRTSTYTATARVVVNPTAVGSTNNNLTSPVLERESEVIKGNTVAERVASAIQLGRSGRALLQDLEVFFVDDSDALEITYESIDPEDAQIVVNAFAEQYVAIRVEQAELLDGTTISELEAQVAEIDEEIAELEQQISAASAERSRLLNADLDASAINDQITSLRTLVSALLVERRQPLGDLADARLEQRTRVVPAEVLQFADLPEVPNGFGDRLLQALGLMFGLGVGVALAFVLHRLDRTARDSGDVELALGAGVLASIPQFGVANRSGNAAVVMLSGGRSARVQRSREAFRRLRSSVQFLGSSRSTNTYLITSARPGEGKSTVAVNLAVALAQGGTSVCLVNADLRRPMVEKMLGAPNTRGLSTWLNDPTASDIMVPADQAPGLVLVPSGPPPANPGELLASGTISNLLSSLNSQFDVVIVDAPPVLSAADASAIARSVDGAFIVVDSRRTDTDTLLRVRGELERAGGTLLGAVLNRDSSDDGPLLGRDRYAYERVSAARADQ